MIRTSKKRRKISGKAVFIKIISFVKRNKLLTGLILLFLLGMTYGSVLASSGEVGVTTPLNILVSTFTQQRADQPIVVTFLSSFTSDLGIIMALFLLGFGAISQPIELLIPTFYGMGLGATMGHLYKTAEFSGVAYCAVLILPHTLISLAAVVLAAKEAIKLSNLFLGGVVPSMEKAAPNIVKLYLIKFGVLILIIAISAIVDVLMTYLFAGMIVPVGV